MEKKMIRSAIVCGLLACVAAPLAAKEQPEILLQRAIQKEAATGDLRAAIEQYKKVAEAAAGKPSVAAEALVRLGRCYERLGNRDARGAYERVVREYAGEARQVDEARARLAALEQTAPKSGIVVRQIWANPRPNATMGAPSPDGRYITTTNERTRDLAIRDLVTGETRNITANKPPFEENAEYSAPSPDGKRIAYGWCRKGKGCDLRLINFDGSGARVLYSSPKSRYVELFGWSPDGKGVLAVIQNENHSSNQMAIISVSDGAVRALKTMGFPHADRMSFSPDGRYILYDAPQSQGARERDVFVMSADGSQDVPLVQHAADDYALGWAPDGRRILFASNRTGITSMWSLRVSEGHAQGTPQLVRKNIGPVYPLLSGMTRSGAFFYNLAGASSEVYTAEIDPEGKLITPPAPVAKRFMGGNSRPHWSPDGKLLAYQSHPSGSDSESVVTILSLETGQERIIAPQIPHFLLALWSLDSQVLHAVADGKSFKIDPRSGEATAIRDVSLPSADGRWAFRWEGQKVVARNLQTGEDRILFQEKNCCLAGMHPSPDSTRLAVLVNRNVVVIPVAGGEPRTVASLNDGERFTNPGGVAWTQSGKYVLFIRSKGAANELWRAAADGGTAQKLDLAMPNLSELRVHPDGRRIAFTARTRQEEIWVMDNFLGGGEQ